MQVVIEIIHPAHITHAVAPVGQELLADQDLVQHIGGALVDVGVGHVLFQGEISLQVVRIEQCHIAGRPVVGNVGGGADQLRGDAVGGVVEVAQDHQGHAGAVQQVDHQATQGHGLGATHDQGAQRGQCDHLAVVPVLGRLAQGILQKLGALGFEVGGEDVEGLAMLHPQGRHKGRTLKARVLANAGHVHLKTRGEVGEGLHSLHLEPRSQAHPGCALRTLLGVVVLGSRYRNEVVAHAAPAQRPLESRIVPDLLHGQHVGVQCPKALPQPGDLALKLGLAVRVLVLVEQATRVGQVEHIAGGHHQGVQRLGEFGGAHGGRAASLWSHGLQPPVSEAAAHGRTALAGRAGPTVRHGPAPGPHRRPGGRGSWRAGGGSATETA